ncbi:MAG: hypothetical protein QXZ25_05645 [Candidatus Bathyarchaeia archaeon]
MLVPGSCFGMEGYLRIGYGCKTEVLKEGLLQLKELLNSSANRKGYFPLSVCGRHEFNMSLFFSIFE